MSGPSAAELIQNWLGCDLGVDVWDFGNATMTVESVEANEATLTLWWWSSDFPVGEPDRSQNYRVKITKERA